MADDSDEDRKRAEELLQQSKEQSRKDTEPSTPADENEGDTTPPLEDAVADAYQAIDDGDLSSNLTLRDENLSALFHGLENADQLADVGDAAAAELNRDPDDTDTRAAVLRLLVRIALQDVDESLLKSGKEGRRQFLETDDF